MEFVDGMGVVMGRVVDQQMEEFILLVNVLVYQVGIEDFIGGIIINECGFFVVKDLEYGEYDVVVSYLGYEDWCWEGIVLVEGE